MTSPECRNGTERCAEALASLHEPDLIINFQGDALLTPAGFVEALISRMEHDSDAMPSICPRRPATAEVMRLVAFDGQTTLILCIGSSRCGWAAPKASCIAMRPASRNASSELSTL